MTPLDGRSYSWNMSSTGIMTRYSAAEFPSAYSRLREDMAESIAGAVHAPSNQELASPEVHRPDWIDTLGAMNANAGDGSGVDSGHAFSAVSPATRHGGERTRTRRIRPPRGPVFRRTRARSREPHAYYWVDPSLRADECR